MITRATDEDWAFARFVMARADEENDPKLTTAVDECFDAIDASSWSRRVTLRGDIADPATLRTIATRWISHPDYPGPWFGG